MVAGPGAWAVPVGLAAMFLVALVALSALAVPLAGGRLGALVELHLRRVWAIYAALGLAVLGVGLPGLPDGLRSLLLVAAYPVGAVFLLANRRVPGMALVALGAALNLLAITANGGVMPASAERPGRGRAAGRRARVRELGRRWPTRGWPSSGTSSPSRPPGRSATSSASATCASGPAWPGGCTGSAGRGWSRAGRVMRVRHRPASSRVPP